MRRVRCVCLNTASEKQQGQGGGGPERWRSYEKIIEGALLGGSEGEEKKEETDGVRRGGE